MEGLALHAKGSGHAWVMHECIDPRLLSIQSINPIYTVSLPSCLAVPFLLEWWAFTMKTRYPKNIIEAIRAKQIS